MSGSYSLGLIWDWKTLMGIQSMIMMLASTNKILGGEAFRFRQKLLGPAFLISSPSWKNIKANVLRSVPISKQYLNDQLSCNITHTLCIDDT